MLTRLVERFDPDEFRVRQDEPNAWPILRNMTFTPRRGKRTQPRVSTLGRACHQVARPHKALPRSACDEKHPRAGLEVLKGRNKGSPSGVASTGIISGFWQFQTCRPFRAVRFFCVC